MASHHFDDHHAVMRFRRRMQTVDGVRHDADCGVEAEGEVRAADIVVDGFGNADDRIIVLAPHVARRAQRAVAADDNKRIELMLLPVAADSFEKNRFVEGAGAGGSEDRAAARENA
jgi:1,6-anhydro-N-acetylmuramate kinase